MYWVFLSIPASTIQTQSQHIRATVVGPMSQAQYTAKYGDPNNTVNPSGGFTNRLTAQAAANAYNANPANVEGGLNAPGVAPSVNAPNPLGGVNAIGDFFHRLTEPSTWVRVGEFVAGGLLVFMGGNALLRGTAAGKTVKSATSKIKAVVK